MSELERLHTVAQVAEALGPDVTERYVLDQCRKGVWPHRRLARGRRAFTAADYAQILELVAAEPNSTEAPRLSFAPRSRRAS